MEQKSTRIGWIDELRGLAVVAMILYHIAFNLSDFLHLPFPWLETVMESRFLGVLHTIFVAVFLGLSGICSHMTRRPWGRVGRVLFGAVAVTAVTYAVFPDQTIWFGVLHCLAVCMALEVPGRRLTEKIPPVWGLVLSVILYAITYRISDGFLLHHSLPAAWYSGGVLTAVGFPSPAFQSLDYVPLLPHIFLFAAGVFIGRLPLPRGRIHCRFLAFCGRHSLAIYLLHQPIIFGIFFLFETLMKG